MDISRAIQERERCLAASYRHKPRRLCPEGQAQFSSDVSSSLAEQEARREARFLERVKGINREAD